MVDLVRLVIRAGNGGDGRISFFRNRRTMKGGPDGGDGGNGGSVIAVATAHENTLRDFAGIANIEADSGYMGGATNMHGANREDLKITLPVGTRIWKVTDQYHPNEPKRMYRIDRDLGRVERAIERRASSTFREEDGVFELADSAGDDRAPSASSSAETDITEIVIRGIPFPVQLIGDLTEPGQELMIARGGRGGRGNETFKSSRNTTPMEAQTGEGGEWGEYIFELQLLADVGLVGFPNAGKSTLLSVLTKANPKIANYPFTTLEPNLGVMTLDADDKEDRKSLVIADIPGLIEGASEGKGLGHEFLRHLSRCKALVFLLALEDAIILDESVDLNTICEQYLSVFSTLEHELQVYEEEARNSSIPFSAKKRLLVLSKADLSSDDKKQEIQKQVEAKLGDVLWISSATREGIEELRQRLFSMVK